MARYDGWRQMRPSDEFAWRNQPYPLHPPPSEYRSGYSERAGYGRWAPTPDAGYMRDPRMMDEAIRRAVRHALFEDTWLDARNIDVQVENGVVTLRGDVRGHLEARYAWDDAWETEGVRGVVSRIEVREPSPARSGAEEG